jgi:hypothetical protein
MCRDHDTDDLHHRRVVCGDMMRGTWVRVTPSPPSRHLRPTQHDGLFYNPTGAEHPTINFSSRKVNGGKVRFTFTTPGETCNTIEFVATGKGTGGGYDMYLNAVVEASDAT